MYRRKTSEMVGSLLNRILSNGDTYEHHKEKLDYKPFLEIQLEILKRIVATEKRISRLKKERLKDIDKIEQARERRKLLKLLGDTIAWILLEYDTPYIRNLAKGHDPGFIYGKTGLILETIALKAAFEVKNHAAVLHDITNCLRMGDLSVISPKGIQNYEMKLVKKGRKKDRRERRQEKRLNIMREFYYKGVSTKIIPGYTSVRKIFKRLDKHNFNEISEVFKEAIRNGFGIRLIEECLIYYAFTSNEINEELIKHIKLYFRDPYIIFGCLDRHIDGLPRGFAIMPFTCFDIPLSYKEKLLFREVNFCVILDINSLHRIIENNGFKCKMIDSKGWIFEISNPHNEKLGSFRIGSILIYRMLYGCLSVKTFLNYIKRMKAPEEDLTHAR